jgi:DNA polymerase-3 subunit beta
VAAEAATEARVDEPGRVLVPGRLLAEIARSLPGGPVQVATSGSETVVTCGSVEFGLLAMPLEDYPELPAPPPVSGTVDSARFATGVGQVVVAASRDDTLPMLTGVRMEFEAGMIRMACTDRYRIAARSLPWTPADDGFQAAVVMPARTLAETAKSLKTGEPTEIALAGAGDTLLGLANAGRRTTARLLDDQFIDYRSRLAGNWTFTVDLAKAAFVEAVRRVALVTERGTPLRLAFSAQEVRIRAAAGDAARGQELLAATLTGDDIDIAINPHLLLDGVSGVEGDTVRLAGTTSTKPVLITAQETPDDEDYRYLVMPIRLSD